MTIYTGEIPDEKMNPIYNTVGRLATQWSMMEVSLEALATVLHQYYGGKDLERALPHRFGQRIRFVRKCLESPPAILAPFKGLLLAALERLSNLADYRHDIIHGYVSKYDDVKNELTFSSVKTRPGKGKPLLKKRKITPAKMLTIGNEAARIGLLLVPVIFDLLANSELAEETEKVLRELGSKSI
jgi:hypothetical protein